MGWQHGWGMMGGWFLWVLLLVLIIIIAVWAVSNLGNRQPREPGFRRQNGASSNLQETPLEILQTRYAQGEISRDEYERMRQDLQT